MNNLLSRASIATGHILFGVYAWLLFLPMLVITIAIATFVPGLQRRRCWVTATARLLLRLCGLHATVTGLENLPDGHCIVVANHASFVDGLVLPAYLPPRFSFVIKGEVRNIALVHFLLNRVGSRFVERFVAAGSVRDARSLVKAALAGESLVFFPEGTFIAKPGLGRFRAGAFAAAIKSELPVVPVSIRGTRKILPARTLLPFHARLQIDILQPIETRHSNSAEIAELARQSILGVLEEPDLLLDNGILSAKARQSCSRTGTGNRYEA